MSVIKVSSNSRTSLVAGAIAGTYRSHRRADIQAIGAGAVNQAVKAAIVAKGFLEKEEEFVFFTPSFVVVNVNGQDITAVRLTMEPQARQA